MSRVQKQSAPLHEDLEVVMECVAEMTDQEPVVDAARRALEKLCQKGAARGKGFDPKKLARLLFPIIGYRDVKKLADPFRYGKGPRDRFTTAYLKKMAKHARALQDFVPKLNHTPFAAYLTASGSVRKGGIIGYLMADEPQLAILDPILHIPAQAARYNRMATPMMDSLLFEVCKYVEETAGPHYQALVDILEPFRISYARDPDRLKMRYRRRKPANTGPQRRRARGNK